MTLSTGAATRITINRATIYQIDLNIYFHDGSLFTLEFRSFRGVVSLIKKFAELHIYVYDPMIYWRLFQWMIVGRLKNILQLTLRN